MISNGKKEAAVFTACSKVSVESCINLAVSLYKKKNPIPNKSTTFNILLDNSTKPFMLNVLLNHSIGLNLLFFHDMALKLNVIPPTNN